MLKGDLFSEPLDLDGVILDAPHVSAFADVRKELPKTTAVMVDPQAYRLQAPSFKEHATLMNLLYSFENSEAGPAVFNDSAFLRRFVQSVLDHQGAVECTSFIAPAFFVDSSDSPWIEVNRSLLKETITQAGQNVFSMLCGSYSYLCKDLNRDAVIDQAGLSNVRGSIVLASPFAAAKDSPAKLVGFIELLSGLQSEGVEVIASRQPAFGLGYMALGVAGFDCGVGLSERFDYASLIRSAQPKANAENEDDKKGGRRRRIYLPQILSSVPSALAESIFSTSGVTGSFTFICNEPCCRDSLRTALARNREHFLYSRSREVSELQEIQLPKWRVEHVNQTLISARQLTDKLLSSFPKTPPSTFRHLDNWSSVFPEMAKRLRLAS